MNLGQARVVIRERATADLVDLSFRFVFGLEPWLYVRLSIALLLPALLLCIVARQLGASWLSVWCLAVALRALCDAPFTLAAGRVMFEHGPTLRAILTDARRLAWRSGWSALLRSSGMILAALPLITLPLIVPRLLFLNEIVLLERLRLSEALQRSERFLGRRRRAGIEASLALLALPVLGGLLADTLGRAVLHDVLQLGGGAGLLEKGGSTLALAGFFAAAPFASVVRYLAYIDVRTRREAWDVQVRFQRLSLDLGRGLS